jgi:hypothetical protein
MPDPDHLRARVFRDRVHADDWRVEKEDEDGSIEVAIFSGPNAYERAAIYADRQYRAYDLVELAPYR